MSTADHTTPRDDTGRQEGLDHSGFDPSRVARDIIGGVIEEAGYKTWADAIRDTTDVITESDSLAIEAVRRALFLSPHRKSITNEGEVLELMARAMVCRSNLWNPADDEKWDRTTQAIRTRALSDARAALNIVDLYFERVGTNATARGGGAQPATTDAPEAR